MPTPPVAVPGIRSRRRPPGWRSDALRTTLWFVPSLLVLAAVVLFGITYLLDRAADNGTFQVPSWVNTGGPDAARTILTASAAAVITVVGVVFSITILALQLASTQFGPRMLRNFIRDIGTQVTLGTFVATFVFSVLALGSVTNEPGGPFVPHISVTVAIALLLVDLLVLIYFIHHVAKSIQLPEVVFGIARDLVNAIDHLADSAPHAVVRPSGPSVPELRSRLADDGVPIAARQSGYLQMIGHARLVQIAQSFGAVVSLVHRPGHFVMQDRPLSVVWPASTAEQVGRALDRAHVVGPHRTVRQDLQFAIDQLVEIAIRALSPAVNDTFTALTCIDWLGHGLRKLAATPLPDGVFRDSSGRVRLIEPPLSYPRALNRAFDLIRQAGRGSPAVAIRQLDSLASIVGRTRTEEQRDAVTRQADMILRAAAASIPEQCDRHDVERAHDSVRGAVARASGASPWERPDATATTG